MERLASHHVNYVEPGQAVAFKDECLRGHGTRQEGDVLKASVAGFIEKTSKLLSVLPVRSRYQAKVGDVVVGRVKEVGDKKWLIDVRGTQYAFLDISAIHLPGSVQRRRTKEDQLQMRDYFVQGDCISAEVQSIKTDGSFNIHMRNLKYGKLVTGVLVTVQQSLVRHLKSHMVSLPMGVDLVLGHNGIIWVTHSKTKAQQLHYEKLAEFYKQRTISIPNALRYEISRIRNCIELLNRCFLTVSVVTILLCYLRAQELNLPTSQILQRQNQKSISTFVESQYQIVKEREIRKEVEKILEQR